MIDTLKFTQFTKLDVSEEERLWACALHLSPLLNFFFPLLGILTPIGIWYHHKDHSEYIRSQARELLNLFLIGLILGVATTCLVIPMIYFLPWFAYFFAFAGVLALPGLLLPFWGAYNAYQGHDFQYPLPLRFFKVK